MKNKNAFSMIEIMVAVLIIGVGVVPVVTLFLSSSRTVEKGGALLEATIACQNILDRAKSDSFLWGNIPMVIPFPNQKYPEFSLPAFFANKYKASGTLQLELAKGHTILGTGANEQNLAQITVTINWIENERPRSCRLVTFKANTNSFDLKTSNRFY
ncbi:prepilin-type N-terminal cleavage/methylation domain-containing protein [bacterium]|nr:prepilin-type N-terminal cleavage/methylation domain-containing protein [bacterium]